MLLISCNTRFLSGCLVLDIAYRSDIYISNCFFTFLYCDWFLKSINSLFYFLSFSFCSCLKWISGYFSLMLHHPLFLNFLCRSSKKKRNPSIFLMMNLLDLLCLFKELCSMECTSQKKCQTNSVFQSEFNRHKERWQSQYQRKSFWSIIFYKDTVLCWYTRRPDPITISEWSCINCVQNETAAQGFSCCSQKYLNPKILVYHGIFVSKCSLFL